MFWARIFLLCWDLQVRDKKLNPLIVKLAATQNMQVQISCGGHMKQTRGPHNPLPRLWQASAVSKGQNLHQAPQGTFPSCPQNLVVLFPSRPLICLKNTFTLLTLENVPEKCLLLPPTDVLLGKSSPACLCNKEHGASFS